MYALYCRVIVWYGSDLGKSQPRRTRQNFCYRMTSQMKERQDLKLPTQISSTIHCSDLDALGQHAAEDVRRQLCYL